MKDTKMLMQHIEPKPKFEFVVNEHDGRCSIVLATRETIDAGGGRPLWLREAGNDEARRAMVRWVGARRDRWNEWGALAQRIGLDAFDAYMAKLWDAEPPALVIATTITPGEDPSVVLLGEMLRGRDGMTEETLYAHCFASPAARQSFLNFLRKNCTIARILLAVGYRSGTVELGRMLDAIAAEPVARVPRGRRRGRQARKAA